MLVAPDGRVVILDFGLVSEKPREDAAEPLEQELGGTPAYMAPEQVSGDAETAASDWYAVGAMLYEALTGRPPFVGRGLQVLIEKQSVDPLPPHRWMPAVHVATQTRDLQDLAMELLAREPGRRPSGRGSPAPDDVVISDWH